MYFGYVRGLLSFFLRENEFVSELVWGMRDCMYAKMKLLVLIVVNP
jgi:hypothetical protein